MKKLKPGFMSILICFSLVTSIYSQQVVDPNYDAKVARPAYTKNSPRILFDEAHYNFHTTTERYKPFADLITNDGYSITPNKVKFEAKTLAGYKILVIANAKGAEQSNLPEASQPAFTDQECDVVRDWVRAGGSLLLIADHAPYGGAAANLASRFGVDMSKGHTGDPNYHDAETKRDTFLVFSRENKLLVEHPITHGRDATERINNILTFTGQSLKGPKGSIAFLKLSDTAFDRMPPDPNAKPVALDRMPNGDPLPAGVQLQGRPPGSTVSAAGRSQGVAFSFGKGRVVVMGEAGMLSAQIIRGPAATMMGKDEILMGMNHKGIDNRQLVLNIMHWLSRLLKY